MTSFSISTLQQGWEDAYQQQESGAALWQEDPIPVLEPAIADLKERDARTVVDLGCGDGRNLTVLVDAGFHCTGVDIAPTGLARASERIGSGCFYVLADATRVPIIDASVDAVTCLDVFGQVADPTALIEEARRLLRPDGLFVVNAFTPEDETYGEGTRIGEHMFAYKDTLFRYYTEEDISTLFAGWKVHRVDRMSWVDPPHGAFRPYVHRHDNWVVYASPR